MAGEGIESLSAADQNAVRLGRLLLNTNPEVAREAKRLAKKADPNLRVPELELEDQIAASAKKSEERTAELERQLIEERVARRREEFHRQVAAEGLDVAEVEKIIVDEKCSPATAIKMAKLQQQTADPTAGVVAANGNAVGTPIEMRPEAEVRKLTGNTLKRWSATLAHEMVDGFRGRNRGRAAAR